MNTLTQYFVPEWIAILFQIVITFPFILIALLVRSSSIKSNSKSFFTYTVVFFVLYLAYIAFASFSGWFNQILLPPKVLLLTTFPYGFFLFVVVMNNATFKKVLEYTSVEDIVRLHIFRLIGVFFVLLALYDALPKGFAFIAGIGDMITAVTSVFVVRAIKAKKSYAHKLTYAWNTFGTIDILFTAIAANVLTKISMDTGNMGVDTLASWPFCIIPAFAPPTILFLHWLIFKKLKENSI